MTAPAGGGVVPGLDLAMLVDGLLALGLSCESSRGSYPHVDAGYTLGCEYFDPNERIRYVATVVYWTPEVIGSIRMTVIPESSATNEVEPPTHFLLIGKLVGGEEAVNWIRASINDQRCSDYCKRSIRGAEFVMTVGVNGARGLHVDPFD